MRRSVLFPGFGRPALLSGLVAGLAAAIAGACSAPETEDSVGERLPPAELRAAVDRATATTGDLITYRIELERDPDVEAELPDPGAGIPGFRIVDLGIDDPETLRSGRVLEGRWFELRADLVGRFVLPPLSTSYREPDGTSRVIGTPEIPVEVESVLPEDPGAVTDIRDIKPLRRVEVAGTWRWWLAGGVLLVLIACAWWSWRRRRLRNADGGSIAPGVPPYELAIDELERLRRTDFSNLRELRRYYFAISSVVRAYIEGRFGLNATDLTTEEILGRLGELARIEPVQAQSLERFLVATDQVKFAAHLPLPDEVDRTFERARVFVESTKPGQDASGAEAA